MANQVHAEWLKEGVRKWNYRRKRVNFRPDLSGVRFFDYLPPDFRDAPKTSRYFEGIDLSEANLIDADLSDLNFLKANFRGANLTEADMSMSNFDKANFTEAKLRDVDARYSHFRGSIFQKSSLKNADLAGVDASGAVFVETNLDTTKNFSISVSNASVYASIDAYRIYKSNPTRISQPSGSEANASDPNKSIDDRTRKNKYDVFFATNRNALIQRGELTGFGTDNVGHLSYGVSEVIIPDGHRIGSIGSPLWKRIWNRRDDRLRLENIVSLSDELFWKFITDTAARMRSSADPTIFIHGFNTSFEEAVLRAAQVGYDIGIGQGVGPFSWPSKGKLHEYAADEASAESTKYLLANFIKSFSENSPTGRINLIAHSMGCRCLVGAIEILASSDVAILKRVNQVILAAADVDSGIMPHQCSSATGLCKRITSYASELDRALQISGWLHSFPRVDITPPTFVLSGIDTVVVNDMNLGDLQHGYVASSRAILNDIFSLLKHGHAPFDRHALEEINGSGGVYWRVRN